MANALNVFGWASASPTSTSEYHQVGEILLNSTPPSGGDAFGWFCAVAGFPGTWQPIALIHNSTLSKVTAAAAIAAGTKVKVTMGPNTYTLPAASAVLAGAELVTLNGSSTSTDVATYAAPASTTLVGTATAAAGTAIRWMSDGANYWYRTN